ncbi:MAG TPA: BON domain-containing protein [Planctomycetota bacterium]|jgi:osmotically-inducible protein OsmY|nr:BON domain-containing protein [Planctomycetota bacterium]
MKQILFLASLALLGGCGQDKSVQAADNTKMNSRDRSGASVTPIDQSESSEDRALTQAVRQSLMEDASLSLNAKNVKVVSRDGKVTLRGVVESQAEKASIESKVKALAGVAECDDQLEVKSN